VDRYDSALASCDAQIGRLLHAIDARKDRERTIVIVYSDHGELFGEHGFTNHGNSLYEPDVRVLLLVRVPGATAATVHEPVSLTDVASTVLDLADLRDRDLDGWTLLPYLFAGSSIPHRTLPLYAEPWHGLLREEHFGLVDGAFKYVRLASGDEMLFDLDDDPTEAVNLVGTMPTVRDRMAEALDARR